MMVDITIVNGCFNGGYNGTHYFQTHPSRHGLCQYEVTVLRRPGALALGAIPDGAMPPEGGIPVATPPDATGTDAPACPGGFMDRFLHRMKM